MEKKPKYLAPKIAGFCAALRFHLIAFHRNHIVLAASPFYAVALGTAGVAWSVGGDMFLIVPALTLGFFLLLFGVSLTPWSYTAKRIATGLAFVFFIGEYGALNFHFHSAPPSTPSPEVAESPPKTTAPSFQSNFGKTILSCDVAKREKPRSARDDLATYRKTLEAYAKAFGVSASLIEIPDGIRLEFTPATPEASLKMQTIQKAVYEFKRVAARILVTASFEPRPGIGQILALMPIDPNSASSIQLKKQVEHMVGASEDACQIL